MKSPFLTTAFLFPLLLSLLFFGCVSETPVQEPTAEPPVEEEPKQPEAVGVTPPAGEPAVGETTVAAQEVQPSDEVYKMDKEEYESTKKDLSDLVQELNKIISQQNYESWLNYLTDEYIDYYSDPKVLQEYSNSPTLSKYNIKLRTLKDYFNYVVVASRRDVRIDDISAISEDKVKAYMIVKDEPIVVYTLERIDDRWKITR